MRTLVLSCCCVVLALAALSGRQVFPAATGHPPPSRRHSAPAPGLSGPRARKENLNLEEIRRPTGREPPSLEDMARARDLAFLRPPKLGSSASRGAAPARDPPSTDCMKRKLTESPLWGLLKLSAYTLNPHYLANEVNLEYLRR